MSRTSTDSTHLKIPDTLLTITTANGRFKATLLRQVGIIISVAHIDPCS